MEQVSPLQFSRYRELKKKFYPSKPNVPSRPQPELPPVETKIVERDWLILLEKEPKDTEKAVLSEVWQEIYSEDKKIAATAHIMKGFSGRRSARILIAQVLTKHQMTFIDIAGHAKSKRFCDCRFEVYYRLRRELGLSLMLIGRMLNKDHTSVLHGYRKMEERLAAGYVLD